MRIRITYDKKITELLNDKINYFTENNFNRYLFGEQIGKLTLGQFLYIAIPLYLIQYNYSLYESSIRDYINTMEFHLNNKALSILNNPKIIPIVEYVEINNELMKIFSVIKTRRDLLNTSLEDFLYAKQIEFESTENLSFLANSLEINQIINYPNMRPVLNNSPYFHLVILSDIFHALYHMSYTGIYDLRIVLTIFFLEQIFMNKVLLSFKSNEIAAEILKLFRYYILNKTFNWVESIYSSSNKYTSYIPSGNSEIFTGFENYIINVIAQNLNENIEIFLFSYLDKLTEYNNIHYTAAFNQLRRALFTQIKSFFDITTYPDLIRIHNFKNFKPDKTIMLLFYQVLNEILNNEDQIKSVLSNILYNIQLLKALNKNHISLVNIEYLSSIRTESSIIEIIFNELKKNLVKVENVIRAIDYNNVINNEYILSAYIQKSDVYTFITDLLTVYYATKILV